MKGNLKYTIVKRSTKIIPMDTFLVNLLDFPTLPSWVFFCQKTCLTTSQCLPSTASFIGELPSASGKFNWPTWQFCLQKPGIFVFFHIPFAIWRKIHGGTTLSSIFCKMNLANKDVTCQSRGFMVPILTSKNTAMFSLNSNSARVSRNQWKVH